jgi:molecular chaperone DnaJ
MEKNYYDILGVSKQASQEEIKAAHRKLVLQYHPDKHRNNKEEAEKKLQEINAAYDVIGDPEKRKQYDMTGSENPFGGGRSSGGFHEGDFSDIFSKFFTDGADIFGGGRGKSRKKNHIHPQNGMDIELGITISLKESYSGVTQKIDYSRFITCSECKGFCAQKGEKPTDCPTCEGTGTVQSQQGWISMQYECSQCHGSGFIIKNPCHPCRGSGRIRITEKKEIAIPAGVVTGSILRIREAGDTGIFGGKTGSLMVAISVQKDKTFSRDSDNNLLSSLKLSYPHLVFGCEVIVTLIDGSEETLKVPSGSQVNDTLLLKGKGFYKPGTKIRGNFLVKVTCDIPKSLSEEAKKALTEYSDHLAVEEKKSDGFLKGFFKKLF